MKILQSQDLIDLLDILHELTIGDITKTRAMIHSMKQGLIKRIAETENEV